MGCTLHQHAHSHGGGSSHGHSHSHKNPSAPGHGHGHSHGAGTGNSVKNPSQETKLNLYQSNGQVTANSTNNFDIEVVVGEGAEGSDHEQVKTKVNLVAVDDTSCASASSSCPPPSTSSDGSHVTLSKQNVNVRAAFIHVIGDFIQSVGVFGAALVIYFKPTWVIVDPICTYLFSVLVLATTYAIVKETVFVLMEGIPKGIDFNDVRETLLHVKGVCKVHNLRIWSLSMDRIALSAHLAIDPTGSRNSNDILRKSSQLVKGKFGFSEVTIQIEDFNEKMQDCRKCQELN